MAVFTVTLPSGVQWIPEFVTAIDHDTCIGCGRCFKVCPRGVLSLRGLTEDGDLVSLDDEDEDEEYERKVMAIVRPEECVGCAACATVCSRKSHTHQPATV